MSGRGPGEGAPEGKEADDWHTYKCPVCSHADAVSLMGKDTVRIRCSHCGSHLQARLRSEDEERVSVQLDKEDRTPDRP